MEEDRFILEFEISIKAMENITRLKILRAVNKEPKCVNDIAEEIGISSAACSAHIGILWRAGFLFRKKQGNKVFYSLNKELLLQRQRWIREFLGIKDTNDPN